ncbi:MAG: hypothetical protein ACRDNX_00550 [Gaiellaceae bacterium]
MLSAGGNEEFTTVLPALAGLIAITIALEFSGAIQAELSRVLVELVGRRAGDRVLDVCAPSSSRRSCVAGTTASTTSGSSSCAGSPGVGSSARCWGR